MPDREDDEAGATRDERTVTLPLDPKEALADLMDVKSEKSPKKRRFTYCQVCGDQLMVGRHRSGWRHVPSKHYDHQPVPD
jgi:hypothetical protein